MRPHENVGMPTRAAINPIQIQLNLHYNHLNQITVIFSSIAKITIGMLYMIVPSPSLWVDVTKGAPDIQFMKLGLASVFECDCGLSVGHV